MLDETVQWLQPTEVVAAGAATSTASEIDPYFYAYEWNLQAVNAAAAWEAGCDGAGVRVAVLDGGIASDSFDLIPNLDFAASTSFVPGMAWNEDSGEPGSPGFWHGTHVAGIIAAAGYGTAGIAPRATIIGVKVLDGGSGTFGAILEGLVYAATDGHADIVNMSLGAFFQKSSPGGGRFFAMLNKVVNFATSQGVLVISAAGNDGIDWDHSYDYVNVPAEAGNGIAVSATGPEGFAYGATNFRRIASYTNYGQSLIHVAAPGGDFTLAPDPNFVLDMVISTGGPGNAYYFAAGTSMAAPAASAVAALLKQRFPNANAAQLKTLLARTADDEGKPGHDQYYGRGFVNALRACVQ